MGRDVSRLVVYRLAHETVLDVYRLTEALPDVERFGIQSQLRRAAVSIPANLVEGASRRNERDWVRFLEIALGSASETRYLLLLTVELGMLQASNVEQCRNRVQHLVLALQKLIVVFDRNDRRGLPSGE